MLPPALGGLKRFARRRMSPGALYLHKAVGAELRRLLDALRGRLRDGAEVREETPPGLGQVDVRLERGVEGLDVERRKLEPAHEDVASVPRLLGEERLRLPVRSEHGVREFGAARGRRRADVGG